MRIDTALSEFVRQSVAAPPPVADDQEPEAGEDAEDEAPSGDGEEPASL
jgi:hypothetical protein